MSTLLPPSSPQLQQQQMQLERSRSKLWILHHAATCPHEDIQSCPDEKYCSAAKRLFLHLNGCSNSKDCGVPGCKHSRGVWKHYRNCRHNNPAPHEECPVCSVVSTPYIPASLCSRFCLPAFGRTLYDAGNSTMATVGSYESVDTSQQQEQKQHWRTTPEPDAKQAKDKLTGIIMDGSRRVSETHNAPPTLSKLQLEYRGESDKENTDNYQPLNAPRKTTTTASEYVMDACGTWLVAQSSEPSSSSSTPVILRQYSDLVASMPEYYHGGTGVAVESKGRLTRYHSLDSPSINKKKNRFLSLRRSWSREEAAEPILGSSSTPERRDENENKCPMDGNQRTNKATERAPLSQSISLRGTRIRRIQRRFMM